MPESGPCNFELNPYWFAENTASNGRSARDGFINYHDFRKFNGKRLPDSLLTFKVDLKHFLKCQYHADQHPMALIVACALCSNQGFTFWSTAKDPDTRQRENELIGNVDCPADDDDSDVEMGEEADDLPMGDNAEFNEIRETLVQDEKVLKESARVNEITAKKSRNQAARVRKVRKRMEKWKNMPRS
jgi:hypothetical protein